LIGFSKSWFDVVFGMNVKNFKYIPLDLTIKESFIIILCILNLIIISYFNFII
jgi:hypothetical protein